jgi:hypothetical protein
MADKSKMPKDRAVDALERDLAPSDETAEGIVGGRAASDGIGRKNRAKKSRRASKQAAAPAASVPNLTSATTQKLTAD